MKRSDSFMYLDDRNDDFQDYSVEATFHYESANNYGADADGNRGTPMTFLDDFEFSIYNEVGEEITDTIKSKDQDLYKRIANDVEARGLGADLESDYDS